MSKFVVFFIRLMNLTVFNKLYLDKIISIFSRIFFACQISSSLKIGKSFTLGYRGLGKVIHGNVIIGDNVSVGTNVTIGGDFGQGGVPVLGDNVYVVTGAKVLGNIKIGNNVVIGANSVVLNNVADNSVFVGVSGKKIRDVVL